VPAQALQEAPAPASTVLDRLPVINKCFGQESVVGVAEALQGDTWDREFSRAAHAELVK
jgi:hypothetical protein